MAEGYTGDNGGISNETMDFIQGGLLGGITGDVPETPTPSAPELPSGGYIEKGCDDDMQIDGGMWLSELGGALLTEVPIPTYEAKSLPEHTWIELQGVEVYPTSGILSASELDFQIGFKGPGVTPVEKYKHLISVVAGGGFHSFYIPHSGMTIGNMLFSKTSDVHFEKGRTHKVNGQDVMDESSLEFTLTMRITIPN